MPNGVQVFDDASGQTLGVTDALAKIIGTVRTTPNQAGSITLPNALGLRIFAIKLGPLQRSDARYPRVNITVQGNVMSWNASRDAALILYGVY